MKTCSRCKATKPYSDFYVRHEAARLRTDCKACVGDRSRGYYADNRPMQLEQRKANYQQHKGERQALNTRWRLEHPQEMQSYKKAWKQRNRGKVNADWMKRYAAKLQATPSWLTDSHIQEMEQIYANCPSGFHVDHIIPLQGKEVRGLHVPWNLQYLPALENVRKGNRL